MVTGDHRRRQRLRVAFKLMLLIALGFILVVSMNQFGGLDGGVVTGSQDEDLSQIQPGEMVTLLWQARPIIVYRRTAADIDRLMEPSTGNTNLVDPESLHSRQPDFTHKSLRSYDQQWFVAINQGTDFGCTLSLFEISSGLHLRDTCRGSIYDLAGRVLNGQYATKNISIPQYSIQGSTLILGGNEP